MGGVGGLEEGRRRRGVGEAARRERRAAGEHVRLERDGARRPEDAQPHGGGRGVAHGREGEGVERRVPGQPEARRERAERDGAVLRARRRRRELRGHAGDGRAGGQRRAVRRRRRREERPQARVQRRRVAAAVRRGEEPRLYRRVRRQHHVEEPERRGLVARRQQAELEGRLDAARVGEAPRRQRRVDELREREALGPKQRRAAVRGGGGGPPLATRPRPRRRAEAADGVDAVRVGRLAEVHRERLEARAEHAVRVVRRFADQTRDRRAAARVADAHDDGALEREAPPGRGPLLQAPRAAPRREVARDAARRRRRRRGPRPDEHHGRGDVVGFRGRIDVEARRRPAEAQRVDDLRAADDVAALARRGVEGPALAVRGAARAEPVDDGDRRAVREREALRLRVRRGAEGRHGVGRRHEQRARADGRLERLARAGGALVDLRRRLRAEVQRRAVLDDDLEVQRVAAQQAAAQRAQHAARRAGARRCGCLQRQQARGRFVRDAREHRFLLHDLGGDAREAVAHAVHLFVAWCRVLLSLSYA